MGAELGCELILHGLRGQLTRINRVTLLTQVVPQIQQLLASDAPSADRFASTRALVSHAKRQVPPPQTMGQLLNGRDTYLSQAYASLLASPVISAVVTAVTMTVRRL